MFAGGIGEYFGVDPVLIRLAWVVFSCMAFAGVVAYIIAAIIMPKHVENYEYSNMEADKMKDAYESTYRYEEK